MDSRGSFPARASLASSMQYPHLHKSLAREMLLQSLFVRNRRSLGQVLFISESSKLSPVMDTDWWVGVSNRKSNIVLHPFL